MAWWSLKNLAIAISRVARRGAVQGYYNPDCSVPLLLLEEEKILSDSAPQ